MCRAAGTGPWPRRRQPQTCKCSRWCCRPAFGSGRSMGTLESHAGDLSARARVENATAPGVPAGLLAGAPLALDGSIRFEEPSRPFQLHASYPTFELRATGQAAGARAVDADLTMGDVARVLPSLPDGLNGPLRMHATARQAGRGLQMRLTASGALVSTVASLQPWLRGPQTADLRGQLRRRQSDARFGHGGEQSARCGGVGSDVRAEASGRPLDGGRQKQRHAGRSFAAAPRPVGAGQYPGGS